MPGVRRNLGQVRDDECLAALVARHRRQRLAHSPAHFPPDALIHLVEHERRHGVVLRQHDLERKHEARQLATRSDFGERARVEAHVQLHVEGDVLAPVCAVRGARLQRNTKPASRHAERRQELVHSLG